MQIHMAKHDTVLGFLDGLGETMKVFGVHLILGSCERHVCNTEYLVLALLV